MSIKKAADSKSVFAGVSSAAAKAQAPQARAPKPNQAPKPKPSQAPGGRADSNSLSALGTAASLAHSTADASDPHASRVLTSRQAEASSRLTEASTFDALEAEEAGDTDSALHTAAANETEPQPQPSDVARGQVEGLEEVRSSDGVTVYKDASGQKYTQFEYEKDGVKYLDTSSPDGTHHVYATSEQDGTSERKLEQTRRDGSTQEIIEVEKDGKIQRVTTGTHKSDQNVADLAGEPVPESFRDQHGSSEVTESRIEVIDTTVNPPETKVVADGRRVTQNVPMDKDATVPNGLEFDNGNFTLSHNSMSTYDENGNRTTVSASGQELNVEARREDGSKVSVRQNLTLDAEDKILAEGASYTGFTRQELSEQFYVSAGDLHAGVGPEPARTHASRPRPLGAPGGEGSPEDHLKDGFDGEANTFLGGDPINLTIQRDGSQAETVSFDKTDSNGDTRRVTRTQDGPDVPVYWSYGETTEGGNHEAIQIVREGDSNFSSSSVVDREPDGSIRTSQRVTGTSVDGHIIEIYNNESEHLRLKVEDVDDYAKETDLTPDQRQRLKDQIASGEPVFADTVDEQFTSPDYSSAPPDSIVSSRRSSTAVSGDGLIGFREESMVEGKFEDDTPHTMYKNTDAVLDREAELPVQLKIDRNKSDAIEHMGTANDPLNDRYELIIDRDGNVREPSNPSANFGEEYDRLDRLQNDPGTGQDPPADALTEFLGPSTELARGNVGRLSTGGLASVMGLAQVWHGLQEDDPTKVATGAAGTLGPVGDLADSNFLKGSKAAPLLGGLGLVGDVIGLGVGIKDFSEGESLGDKFKATLGIGSSILGIGAFAAGSGPLALPLGLAALGLMGAAFGYDLIRNAATGSDPAHLDRELFPDFQG